MRVRRVLVVFKASKLDRYRERGTFTTGLNHDDEDVKLVFQRLQASHAEHRQSVAAIESILDGLGLEVTRASAPRKRDCARADLVLSFGGDGTFLWTARKVSQTPIVGVNSAPGTSVGRYCACNIAGLPATLDAILSGTLQPRPLTRIEILIRGNRLPYTSLNDVLFCHKSPGAATHYLLRHGETREFQVSSGVWVSTASGSTGGIRSAGGDLMDADDDRLQYRVREPFIKPGIPPLQLMGGFADELKFVSRSPSNQVFLDGHEVSFQVGLGHPVVLRRAEKPLLVYGYRSPTEVGR